MTRPRAALSLALLLALTGCAAPHAEPTAPPAASSAVVRPGAADVAFLSAMADHLERTLAIIQAAAGRVSDPELRTLVAAIEATESDELDTIRRWLAVAPDGGTPTPPGRPDASVHSGHVGHEGHPGHAGHPGHSGPSAPSADPDLARLRAAAPGRFDAVLIDVLTAHQRAAAALARGHVPVAVSPEVRDLADRIDRSRTAEIALMARLPAANATEARR